MEAIIKEIPSQLLVGQKLKMSLAENKTFELWRNFLPRRGEINFANKNFYSVEIYPEDYFKNFSADNAFEKWAVMEVDSEADIPEGMELLLAPGGTYACFHYKGRSSEAEKAYRFIFEQWLPQSGYVIDQKPHFAVMGEKYSGDHENSEEEILIPVKKIIMQ